MSKSLIKYSLILMIGLMFFMYFQTNTRGITVKCHHCHEDSSLGTCAGRSINPCPGANPCEGNCTICNRELVGENCYPGGTADCVLTFPSCNTGGRNSVCWQGYTCFCPEGGTSATTCGSIPQC